MKKIDTLISACESLLRETTNCESARADFLRAETPVQTASALRTFWVSAVDQIPVLLIDALSEFYPSFKADFNSAGVYFNEPPMRVANDIVFVGDTDAKVAIPFGRPRVIVLGRARVSVSDHARCECRNANAVVEGRQFSRIKLIAGSASAYERCYVDGTGEIASHDCSSIYIRGGRSDY